MINELSMLFDMARGIAWFAFGATFLLATGLAIFGGPAQPAEDEAKAEPLRKAA